ncbi:MAG: hypothetical protein A3I89_00305 [Candidatus Harrisonbacteria bacterium RIFCSPLOWO2_02_FULL_41_11]|uniref:DUF456 domain-containing protein n=1 Tax=Candidatus Harrisonbacteria bacterium RIFCSPHIGHO2_02_FULL_42_16 TaxID=1798404 RepID=A0A1G1ZGC5_9BACT|nr:MAG: hypothetical protein A3B92_03080 [Candidatus Harrisonbacteria bacterium RIFCSPHIGHO2_02_FULL_42_16]OGY65797.1 MAG: hypothetical protein A3I89_00305 [Candidatus Harrisonbacteria bacterium RIFCSPLOWO2_02_FULL_41_11]
MDIGDILLIIFSFVLAAVGAVGVIVPFLPGVLFAWLGMLIFAYITEFSVITVTVVLVFLGLMALTAVLDIAAPILGAKKYQASRYGIAGSFIGALLGVVFLGPPGIIIGPFAGAFIGEFVGGKKPEEAVQSAKGTVIGFLAGSAIKLALIAVMLGFMISALFTFY